MQANRSKHWIFESTRESMLKWKRCRNFFHSPIVRINAPKWHSPSFAIGLTPKSVYSKNVPRIPKCNPHAISWPALQSTVNENQGTAKKTEKMKLCWTKYMRFAKCERASSNEYTLRRSSLIGVPVNVGLTFSGVPLVSLQDGEAPMFFFGHGVRCDYRWKTVVPNKWITYGMFYI